nr:retrovirus-related Pol polyprotein from transposon TNT 1-94 [Tanacetum cinerariifolium]
MPISLLGSGLVVYLHSGLPTSSSSGKDNKENILKSIDEGPFQMGTFQGTLDDTDEGALHLGPVRPRVFSDLTQEEKDRYKANIRATNILLQGLSKDIYTLINHYTDAKDIQDNVKMILEGFELIKDDREFELYDDFEHFKQNKGETIHDYYIRFTKLVNDMRNIKMTMVKIHLNSKFLNNMQPEWVQENGAVLNEKQLLLITSEQANTFDEDVDEALVLDMVQNEDNIFQADQCDAFDSDVDDALTAQIIFMANLSSARPVFDEAGPSYDF